MRKIHPVPNNKEVGRSSIKASHIFSRQNIAKVLHFSVKKTKKVCFIRQNRELKTPKHSVFYLVPFNLKFESKLLNFPTHVTHRIDNK